jgi:hypothetical protein
MLTTKLTTPWGKIPWGQIERKIDMNHKKKHKSSELEPHSEESEAVVPENKADEATTTDPISVLTQEIKLLAAAGNNRDDILTHVMALNRSQVTPISTDELVRLVEELTDDQDQGNEGPPTGKDLLSKLAEPIIPFHDEKREPYFFYEGESYKAPSKPVADRLKYLYLRETGVLPPSSIVKEILDIKESIARFEGELVNLKNRVSSKEQAIYYDMRDKRYLEINSSGWKIVPADFPLFRRYQHMQTQVEPVTGGDPWRVFDYITVNEEDRLLVLVYLVSLFIPNIAHPVFALFGEQGSSKSFFSSVINRLVDPTITERIIQPKNERNLIQTVKQKYVTVLDNLSKIDSRVSDIFCQVCTGGSISLRQLYTDEGENIAHFRHIVILNSISLAIVNADLMDRSIILKLHRIKPEDRKPEQDLWADFETARPGILGGIFDTIVRAMVIHPTLDLKQLPRLADFAKWGYAIAEALGKNGPQFLEDFSQNIKRQNESVVEKNVLCQTILRLMADKQTFLKSVADTHNALKTIAGDNHKDATFPKLSHHLRSCLDVLRSTLADHGISFEFLDRQKDGVKILFSKAGSPATPAKYTAISAPVMTFGAESGVSGEPGEADSEIPEFEIDETLEVVNA